MTNPSDDWRIPEERRRLWPEQWAIQAAVEADRLDQRMRVALAGMSPGSQQKSSEEAIKYHLGVARVACLRPPKRRWRGVRDRWRGTSVEQAYRSMHTAKVFLVDLLPTVEVNALTADVSARMATVLDRNDPRRVEAEKSLQSPDVRVRRAALKQAMETSYDASDEEYSRLRDFRNIILLTAALIALFLIFLGIAVRQAPQAMPLCFQPSVSTAAGEQEQATHVCPSGNRQNPSRGDLPIVAGLGAIGGGLAALVAIRNLRGTSTPYSIPVALAVLKVPAGALTAVAGILLLGGGFAPGFSNLDSQRQILAYALVFGYAQQIITRLVDERAQSILHKIPSKDREAKQPEAPVALPDRLERSSGEIGAVANPQTAQPAPRSTLPRPKRPTEAAAPTQRTSVAVEDSEKRRKSSSSTATGDESPEGPAPISDP